MKTLINSLLNKNQSCCKPCLNRMTTDGDSLDNKDNKDWTSELAKKISEMKVGQDGPYTFKCYTGDRRESIDEFLEQFAPYKYRWEDKEYLGHVKMCLKGMAKDWYEGSINYLFKTPQEFETEIREMFATSATSGTAQLLERLSAAKMTKGRYLDTILTIYPLQRASNISIKDTMEILTKSVLSQERILLNKGRTWKEIFEIAGELDESFLRDREIKRKMCGKENVQRTVSPNETRMEPSNLPKRKLKCFRCHGEHLIIKDCKMPKNDKEVKSLQFFELEHEPGRPQISLDMKGEKIKCLLDTGASANFISFNLIEKYKIPIQPNEQIIKLGTGSCRSEGSVKLTLKDAEKKYEAKIEALVIKGLNDEFILGYPAMRFLNIKIMASENKIQVFNGEECNLREGEQSLKLSKLEAQQQEETPIQAVKFGQNTDLNEKIKALILKSNNVKDHEKKMMIKHEIQLKEGYKPCYARPYRRSENETAIITGEIEKLLDKGIIREIISEFASPVVMVKKKDGSIRFCVDYRKLNDITVQKPFPIPNMEEAIDGMGQGKWFSALDLESGYHQVEIEESDKSKTAFITRDGLFEWNRMPFELINAPYTFQRIMNYVFKGLLWRKVIVYLDDILVFSDSPQKHLEDLKEVIARITNFGLRLNLKKCQFGVTEVDFLGFRIKDGKIAIKVGERNKLFTLKNPSNVSELRSLLGFAAFFKKFIPKYTEIVMPLLDRLKKGNFKIEEKEIEAIEKITDAIRTAKSLTLPNMKEKFYVYTDASNDCISGALSQIINDEESVVMWISRKLSPAEMNYTVTEKECLAIVWCIEKFKIYLVNHFNIRTDHSALTWLINQKMPGGRLTRWIMRLQEFKFTIEHISGKRNVIADALSRNIVIVEPEAELNALQTVENETILSEIEKIEVIARIHEELGHAGVASTYLYLSNKVSWKGM